MGGNANDMDYGKGYGDEPVEKTKNLAVLTLCNPLYRPTRALALLAQRHNMKFVDRSAVMSELTASHRRVGAAFKNIVNDCVLAQAMANRGSDLLILCSNYKRAMTWLADALRPTHDVKYMFIRPTVDQVLNDELFTSFRLGYDAVVEKTAAFDYSILHSEYGSVYEYPRWKVSTPFETM